MVQLRQLKEADIGRLTEICRLGMTMDVWYDDLLREKTVGAGDYEPELGIVAEQDGELVGFAQGTVGPRLDETWGWIRLLAVHPDFRCRGIGRELLEEMEKRLKQRGAMVVSIMDVPGNYQMPGVDIHYKEAFCFLPKMGYKRGMPNINLICDVQPDMFRMQDKIERLKGEGFLVRRAVETDWEKIEKFLAANWKCWIGEVRSSFDNDPKTLYICIHEGEVVGFCAYEGNNRGMGWFGPMGVAPITRGKGIGAMVCLLCLRDIALAGHDKAIIPWVGPVRFYDKVCNAEIDRLFWTFSKSMQEAD